MSRPRRITLGGYVYHVINRANGRLRMFRKNADFEAFEAILAEGIERAPGEASWIKRTAAKLSLESTLRPRGRLKKSTGHL